MNFALAGYKTQNRKLSKKISRLSKKSCDLLSKQHHDMNNFSILEFCGRNAGRARKTRGKLVSAGVGNRGRRSPRSSGPSPRAKTAASAGLRSSVTDPP